MKKQNSPTCAFTLIELLAVIAIIGILAAILIPVVAKVKNNAAETQARSNLRQIGVAFNLYVAQEGNYPYGGLFEHETIPNCGWDKILVDAGVIPEEEMRELVYSPLHEAAPGVEFPRSYSMTRTNYGFGIGVDNHNDKWSETTKNAVSVESPPTTLILSEKFVPGNSYGSDSNCVIDFPQESIDQAPGRMVCNYLFADGHVEALRPEETIGEDGTLTRPKGYWTIDPTD